MHLSFEQQPVRAGDFWGLRWAGHTNYTKVAAYLGSSITTANTMSEPFGSMPITVYTNSGDDHVYIGFSWYPEGSVYMFK